MNTNKILDLLYSIENLGSVLPTRSNNNIITHTVPITDNMYIRMIRYRKRNNEFEKSVSVYFSTSTHTTRIISLYDEGDNTCTTANYTNSTGLLMFSSNNELFENRHDIFDDESVCSIDVKIDDAEFFQFSTLCSNEAFQCANIIRNYKFRAFKTMGIVLCKLIELSDDEIAQFTKACIHEYKNIKNNHIT